LDTAIESIIDAYGEDPESSQKPKREFCMELLTEFPALLVVDDIDTLEDEAEKAIEFLLMDLPSLTRSRVLVTSRRALFGMQGSTTYVSGLSPADAEAFLRSRCALMGIRIGSVLRLKDRVIEATDSSPLFMEDLLRLTQAGLDVEKAIGLWLERRGDKARRYAMEREYERLGEDARKLLLALSLEDRCAIDQLRRALDWDLSRVLHALEQLRLMFLFGSSNRIGDDAKLSLNQNTKKLVLDVFAETESYRRVQRQMQASIGQLTTKRAEERHVLQILRKARLQVNRDCADEAEQLLCSLLSEYPARADIHANLGWTYKKKQRVTDAREQFRRAHELRCKDRDAYWHWSELEANEGEWTASEQAAEFGLAVFPDDQGLLFRKGYALHRRAKEEYCEGTGENVSRLCERAVSALEESLRARNAEERNSNILAQTHRALVLTAETLGDGRRVRQYLERWADACQRDPTYYSEYERLRFKFPGNLPAVDDSDMLAGANITRG
jgi:hypothetical protein